MTEAKKDEVKKEKSNVKKRCTGVEKSSKLTILAKENTKRGASAERFKGYFEKKPKTVQEALDAGLTMGDIHYDIIHGFISVEGTKVEEYAPSPRGPRTGGTAKKEAAKKGAAEVPATPGASNF